LSLNVVAVVVIIILLQLTEKKKEGNGCESGFVIKPSHNDNHRW
jgi:hypothetical protein